MSRETNQARLGEPESLKYALVQWKNWFMIIIKKSF